MSASAKPINESLKEYGRGITGGLLFSLPMLYTMELWWAGFIASSLQLIIYFIVGFVLLMVYNRYVGMRQGHSFWEGLLESIEEMGVALILTFIILYITGRISPLMSLNEISGKIIVEGVTVAIGISVGKSQLGTDEEEEGGDDNESQEENEKKPDFWRSIGI